MDQVLPLSQASRPAGWSVARMVRNIEARVELLRRRHRQRADLRRLLRAGPHLIADIGLDHEAASVESRLPFWRT